MHPFTDKTFHREARLERESVNEEARTAEFSFSSDAPVERAFGNEILDHAPESVRLGRLSDGGPVLLGHDPDQHVGVVERVWLDGRKGRVLARFSRSDRGTDVLRDVVDGIRRNVSVGYRVHAAVAEDEKRGKQATYRVTDWEPFEVSMVSIPADVSVGVGRAMTKPQQESKPMDNEVDIDDVTEERSLDVSPEIDVVSIEEEGAKRERERQTEIRAIADQYKKISTVQIAAQAALRSATSVDSFRTTALELISKANLTLPTDLGLTPKEVQRYSLMRMLRAQFLAKERGTPMEKTAPYEYRLHQEMLDRLPAKRADDVQGLLIPFDVQSAWTAKRAAPADTVENIHMVSTDHLAAQFIVGLRATSAVMSAGATSLTGLVGDVSIPREESIPVEWLTEDEDSADQDYVTSAVTLSPTTVAGSVPITRRLLKQSSPDVDAVVTNNLVLGLAEEIDKQALQGDGVAGLPTGIRNLPGVLTQLISTGAITWAQAVGFESTVEVDSNLHAGGSYIMHPTMKGIAKTTGKDAGSGLFIWENSAVNGYPAYSSTHAGATADGIVFGNFSNLLIGFWGVLDVMMDWSTKAAAGGLVIRTFQDVDVAARRDNAFCIETLV